MLRDRPEDLASGSQGAADRPGDLRDPDAPPVGHRDLRHPEALSQWYRENFGTQARGLSVGEKRPFTVQQGKKGGPYLRFSCADRKKGDVVYGERTADGRYIFG